MSAFSVWTGTPLTNSEWFLTAFPLVLVYLVTKAFRLMLDISHGIVVFAVVPSCLPFAIHSAIGACTANQTIKIFKIQNIFTALGCLCIPDTTSTASKIL